MDDVVLSCFSTKNLAKIKLQRKLNLSDLFQISAHSIRHNFWVLT